MTVKREIIESPMPQGVNEVVSYTLDTSPWGGSPSNVSVTVYDYTEREISEDTDVTAEVMPTNDPDVDNDVITLSPLQDLEAGKRYRVTVQWEASTNTLETYCMIDGEA